MHCPACFNAELSADHCEICGFDRQNIKEGVHLPVGTSLFDGAYTIGKVLGKPGGFGITYLGWDASLQIRVAIKEFLPRQLAARGTDGTSVRVHSQEDFKDFRYGIEQFLQEARTIAKFNHPNIIRVRTFFEENGTAYLVMDYLDGESFEEYLQRVGKLKGEDAIALLDPILDGLAHMHKHNILHRDIKPSNIYLTTEGKAVLLDFGAARHSLTERSQSLTAVITRGFAPPEQYSRKGKQGPWTDVYACAATLYIAVTGVIPTEANDRIVGEVLVEPMQLAPDLLETISSAIMQGLALDSAQRPQTAEAFRNILHQPQVSSANLKTNFVENKLESNYAKPKTAKTSKPNRIPIIAAILVAIVGVLAWQVLTGSKDRPATMSTQSSTLTRQPEEPQNRSNVTASNQGNSSSAQSGPKRSNPPMLLNGEDFVLAGIKLGYSPQRVTEILGKPRNNSVIPDTGGRWFTYEYSAGLEVLFVRGTVARITVKNKQPDIMTNRHIALGRTRQDVLKAYGRENLKEVSHNNGTTMIYRLPDKPSEGLEFNFGKNSDNVESISIQISTG